MSTGLRKQHNLLDCPSCGATVIEGTDTCPECLMDLRSIDIPETAQGFADSELNDALSVARLSRPLVISPATSVREVIELLRGQPDNAAIVVQSDGWVIGVFTERDVLMKIAGHPDRLRDPITIWMTPDPVLLRESDSMAVALNKMGDGGFRHIPLLDGETVAACVSATDVMRWLMARYFE